MYNHLAHKERNHMQFLFDPNTAYLVLMAGIVLTTLAIAAPGTGILEILALGILGLAGYAAAHIGITGWAMALLLASIVPLVFAIRKPKRIVLLILSMLGIVVGSLYLFPYSGFLPAVSPVLAIITSVLVIGFIWFTARKVIQASKAAPFHNPDKVIGMTGLTKTPVRLSGSVQVGSELWSARSDKEIPAGIPVKVIKREGFTLTVEEDKKSR
jgi:membrane-bound serine protease (ClpP class)